MPGITPEQSSIGNIQPTPASKQGFSWSFFDAQLNKYKNGKVSQRNISFFAWIWAIPKFVINWFKVYEPRWRTTLALLVLVALLSTIFFLNSSLSQAASFTFVQTDWSGGVSATTATHPGNQSGWTNFSAQTNADTSVTGSVKTATYTSNFSETFTATTYRDDANTPAVNLTPAFVQGTSHGAGSILTISTPFVSGVTSGNVIVGAMVMDTTINATSITATCVTGNLTIVDSIDNGFFKQTQYYGIISSSGACTVTANFSGVTNANLGVQEVSGVSTSSPLDGHTYQRQSDPGNGANAISSGPIVTTVNGDYIFGTAFDDSGNNPTFTAGTGYTARVTAAGSGGFKTEDRVQTTAGSISATFTMSPSGPSPFTMIMALKANSLRPWATSGQLSLPGGTGSGSAQSLTVDSTTDNIRAATLTKNDTVGTGTITYYLSNDGSTFTQVTPTTQLVFATSGSDLRFKVALTGNATVQDINISYTGYNSSADLTSSAFNSTDSTNLITKLAWNATVPASQTIKFQIRSAPDSSGSPGTWSSWCGYADCSGSTYFTTSDNNVTLSGSHPLRIGANDQWFQYKIFFTTDGTNTATLDDLTISYVVNAPPQFDANYPTAAAGGTSASQITNSASSDFGKVTINYRIRDTDTNTGTTTPGFITPSFEYNVGGGWLSITSGNLAATDLNNKSVDTSSYTTYSATWNAQAQTPNVYTTSAQVRVTLNDNEAASNTTQATTANFILDTKVPAVSAFTIDSTTDQFTLTATDDTALEYRISNNSDLSADGLNGTSGQWQAAGGNSISVSPAWNFTGSPSTETIYGQVRDVAGNLTSVTAVAPATLQSMDIKDISNPSANSFKAFVSWTPYTSVANATFTKYEVFRSTDGSSFSSVSNIIDVNTNYYADFGLTQGLTYYYKVRVVDSGNDKGNFSSTISEVINGQGGTDSVAPSISAVTVAETQATYARITWTTDELSDSRIDYSISPSTGFGSGQTNASFVESHNLTLVGLTPNTTYLFRVKSTDIVGNTGTNDNGGAGFSFTTSSGPIISNVTETSVNNSSATIFWNTSTDSDSHVTYSTSSNLSSSTTVGTDTLVGGSAPYQHSVTITSLAGGTTYYYYVSSTDGSANTSIDKNGSSYYSFRTTTDTVAPVISDVSTPVVAATAAVVVWQTDELATTQLRWGPISGSLATLTTADPILTIFHVVSISGLAEDTEYFFTPISADGAANETTAPEDSFTTGTTTVIQQIIGGGGGGGGQNVTLDTTAPKISGIATSEISSFKAKVSFATDEDSIGFVQYGKTSGKYDFTAGISEYTKSPTINLTGLNMGSDYFYRVKAVDKAGNVTTSEESKFKTLFFTESTININDAEAFQNEVENAIEAALPSLVPPFISSPQVIDITDSSATIKWRTNLKTYSVVAYAQEQEYDAAKDKPYTVEISNTSDKVTDHEIVLPILNPNTRYHFQVKSFSLPQLVGQSGDLNFVTKALNIQAQINAITNSSFHVAWRTTDPTSSVVEYRNTKTGVLNQKAIDEKATSHEILVDGLTPATTYEVSVFGINAKGNKVQTATAVKITTSQDTASPEIISLKIDTAIVPGRNDRAQTIISWKTNEPATSTVFYEEGVGVSADSTKPLTNKIEITNSFVLDHAVVLSVLKPGGLYRIQVASTDTAGNVTTLPIKTIVVPRQSESILDVVFKNFEDTFKFLRQIGK